VFQREERRIAKPNPANQTHANDAVASRALVDVQHEAGVKHLQDLLSLHLKSLMAKKSSKFYYGVNKTIS
jgi:hypothetical protein